MRLVALVVAWLACAGRTRRVHISKAQEEANQLKSLAAQLLTLNHPVSSIASSRRPVSQLRTVPSSTPLMQQEADIRVPSQIHHSGISRRNSGSSLQKPSDQYASKSISKSVGKNVQLVQGESLKTWAYLIRPDRVQVHLSTDGRPLEADVDLWEGPDNTPVKMNVYSEDGSLRPFRSVIATPGKGASTIAVRNTGMIEFPLAAYVIANDSDEPVADFRVTSRIVQGGALRTFDFDPSVESVEIMIRTDGRPLNAKIELLQGPNNVKTVVELYGENGLERPFFAVIDTPGVGNVVRVMNLAPVEFPLFASVEPHSINDHLASDPIISDR
jgi:hypothetical protein